MLAGVTSCLAAKVAKVSPFNAVTMMRRKTTSGANEICALSAKCSVTSLSKLPCRATNKVEPCLTCMPLGMGLMLLNSDSDMLTNLPTSAIFMVLGTDQAVQLARGLLACSSRRRRNLSALSQGNKISGVPAAKITGLLIDGLSALKSSKLMPAKLAASFTSMSRVMLTDRK